MTDLMNPGQAKSKWCPLAFVATFSASGDRLIAGCNKDSEGQIRPGAYCIATQCMAWRTVGNGNNNGYCGAFGLSPTDTPATARIARPDTMPVEEPDKPALPDKPARTR